MAAQSSWQYLGNILVSGNQPGNAQAGAGASNGGGGGPTSSDNEDDSDLYNEDTLDDVDGVNDLDDKDGLDDLDNLDGAWEFLKGQGRKASLLSASYSSLSRLNPRL